MLQYRCLKAAHSCNMQFVVGNVYVISNYTHPLMISVLIANKSEKRGLT